MLRLLLLPLLLLLLGLMTVGSRPGIVLPIELFTQRMLMEARSTEAGERKRLISTGRDQRLRRDDDRRRRQ
jgi:hypothetical protein